MNNMPIKNDSNLTISNSFNEKVNMMYISKSDSTSNSNIGMIDNDVKARNSNNYNNDQNNINLPSLTKTLSMTSVSLINKYNLSPVIKEKGIDESKKGINCLKQMIKEISQKTSKKTIATIDLQNTESGEIIKDNPLSIMRVSSLLNDTTNNNKHFIKEDEIESEKGTGRKRKRRKNSKNNLKKLKNEDSIINNTIYEEGNSNNYSYQPSVNAYNNNGLNSDQPFINQYQNTPPPNVNNIYNNNVSQTQRPYSDIYNNNDLYYNNINDNNNNMNNNISINNKINNNMNNNINNNIDKNISNTMNSVVSNNMNNMIENNMNCNTSNNINNNQNVALNINSNDKKKLDFRQVIISSDNNKINTQNKEVKEDDESFYRKDHVKIVIVETKAKQCKKKFYVCDFPGCGREFSRRFNLKMHQAIHNPKRERPFICDKCGKSFCRIYELRRHEVVHSKERKFVCEYCQQKFSRKDPLLRHLAKRCKFILNNNINNSNSKGNNKTVNNDNYDNSNKHNSMSMNNITNPPI
ncbi:hypothetical protein BCR36DRAFT_5638 [Piromyces finnis]|uniref:C2H2-type domain-containing protein n=1 Tax=Piromyces finnis TaxID=1754191 RepID=A0A1Y1VNQ3_9FUNG|nr:hypothetical protein BCR36DRAFT_5638 [Piromyces finnis]|eukprot:ORX61034.1 hypothetical protein BCR36DRAFT_5638 [Piromyces finnis]